MSFSNPGNVWVWDRMGLYGRHGGHVRLAPHLQAADAWILKYGGRSAPAKAKPAKPATASAPAKPAEPTPEQLAVRAARERYGAICPEAFHAKRDALRKGWTLVRGVPTWSAAMKDCAVGVTAPPQKNGNHARGASCPAPYSIRGVPSLARWGARGCRLEEPAERKAT
jgi:hypothetical protein